MIKAHPYRAVLTVLSVMAVFLFVSGMIGASNDGPWGGFPAWLGASNWFGFLGLLLVLMLLTAYLGIENLKWRKAHRAQGAHQAQSA